MRFPIGSWKVQPVFEHGKVTIHKHMTRVVDEYAKMEREVVQLLKVGALQTGTNRQKLDFLLCIERDYEAMAKDKEDP